MGGQAEKGHLGLKLGDLPLWLKAVLKEEFPTVFSNDSSVRTRPKSKVSTLKDPIFQMHIF